MKQLVILSLTIISAIAPASARTEQTLRGVTFDVDTLEHYVCGPAMTYTQLRFQSQAASNRHFTVNVIETQLAPAAERGVEFKMHLGRDSVHTSEAMTAVARRHTDADHQYLAAINGDFFITWASTPGMLGYPNMTACTAGQMALSDNVDHDNHVDAWIMGYGQGAMWCDQTVLDNRVTLPDGTTSQLYGVNFARRDDARRDAESDASDVVFYNELRGRYTGSSAGWREVSVKLADGERWAINSPVKLEVTSDIHTTGHMAIPRDGGVLAANTAAAINLQSLRPGDIITLNLGLSLPSFGNITPDVKEVVGGDVTLLRNGEAVMTANRFINARDSEYPRTMVGYDTDRTRMIMCTVDGKTSYNTGCSYPQGADLMRNLGCIDAINFDGGGSTMMWLQQPGIVNTPSDGQERAVGSGLFAVLNAPADNSVATIAFRDWAMTVPQYGIYTPTFLGYNRYGQLIDMDVEGVNLSCDPSLGTISDDGRSLIVTGTATGALHASLGDSDVAIPVSVVPTTAIAFATERLLIDNIHPCEAQAYSIVGDTPMALASEAISWSSDDHEIATIDSRGIITGLVDGSATISASVGGIEASFTVDVQCPTAREMAIDTPMDPTRWTAGGSNVKDLTVSPSNDGVAVDYTVSSSRSPRVTLTPDTPRQLWSRPDAIAATITPTGATVTAVTLNVSPANGRAVAMKADLKQGDVNEVTFAVASSLDTSDPAIYPLTLNSIAFSISGTGSGRIDMPRLATIYDDFTGVEHIGSTTADALDPYAPVVYYNLQGIRIDRPTHGIFIRKQGARVEKIEMSAE